MATTLNLKSIYESIDPLLDDVQTTVRSQWIDAFQLVYGKDAMPPRLGGKMMRPALCFFSASACGADDLGHFNEMASAMELLHLAALAHDDVVDSADMRRGETSLNRLWDNHTAVLGGDYLVAKALRILTVYDSCSVISSALDSIHQMAEGELMNFGVGKENMGEEDCIRLSEKKTASLFAVSCCTPSLLTNPEFKQPLHDYGMGMGTAFQLIDDLIDLEQDEETLGKPSCGDIVEGKVTLPMIYMKEAMNDSDRSHFESMHGQLVTDENRNWVREKLFETKAHERIINQCDAYAEQSKSALDALPHSSAIDSMKQIAEFVLIRNA